MQFSSLSSVEETTKFCLICSESSGRIWAVMWGIMSMLGGGVRFGWRGERLREVAGADIWYDDE